MSAFHSIPKEPVEAPNFEPSNDNDLLVSGGSGWGWRGGGGTRRVMQSLESERMISCVEGPGPVLML